MTTKKSKIVKKENKYNYCLECIDLDLPNLKSEPLDKFKKIHIILQENSPLPNELIFKIIELSINYMKCTFCDTILGGYHSQRAKYYGKYYKHYDCYMCDNCCWCEVG